MPGTSQVRGGAATSALPTPWLWAAGSRAARGRSTDLPKTCQQHALLRCSELGRRQAGPTMAWRSWRERTCCQGVICLPGLVSATAPVWHRTLRARSAPGWHKSAVPGLQGPGTDMEALSWPEPLRQGNGSCVGKFFAVNAPRCWVSPGGLQPGSWCQSQAMNLLHEQGREGPFLQGAHPGTPRELLVVSALCCSRFSSQHGSGGRKIAAWQQKGT